MTISFLQPGLSLPRKYGHLLKTAWFIPMTLGVVCLISYGLLVAGAGYYGDDLSYVWLGYNAHQMANFFLGNRPVLGVYFDLMTRVIGPAPWHWHLFALIWRWISAVAFWKLLDTLWPGRKAMTGAGAVLFAAYPGLYLSGEAMAMSPYYLQFAALAGSMIATIQSLRQPKKKVLWIALAVAGSFINLQLSEYFYFLELLRFPIIWYELSGKNITWPLARKTLLHALPYLVLLCGFVGLRFLGLGNASSYPIVLFDRFLASPFQEYQALLMKIVSDIWRASLESFLHALTLPGLELRSNPVIITFIICMAIAGIIAYFFLKSLAQKEDQSSAAADVSFGAGWVISGLAVLLLSGWPIWVAGIPILDDATSSRFMLPFIPGACLLMVGLIGMIHPRKLRWGMLAVFIAAAIGFQVLTSYQFIQEKTTQASLLWQMSERMPGVKPGTLFILNDAPLAYNSENSNTAMVNLLYTPVAGGLDLKYFVYQEMIHNKKFENLLAAPTEGKEYHMIGSFTRQYVITANFHAPHCFRILDPDLDPLIPDILDAQIQTAGMTNFDAILMEPEDGAQIRPSEVIYGRRPADDWCTSFEQASLAAQFGDWEQVQKIGDRAFAKGWTSNDPMELVVFIEGYAHQRQWAGVTDLLNRAIQLKPEYATVFCRLKTRIQATTPPAEEREQALSAITCP
jgi:hypothetical protein